MNSEKGKREPAEGAVRRARTVAELQDVMLRFSTPEGVAQGLAFEPRESDVLIATYPKCGTTLMQQIVHGLRTGGDMDFRDISEVVPWIELAADLELDLAAEQRANPRAFKTHLGWDRLPKGGRSIYLLRDPEAVLISFYDFFSGWFLEPGALTLETFALDYVLSRSGDADYWEHLISWWPRRGDSDVLYLFYEELIADLPGSVARVCSFIGLEPDPGRIALASRQASLDFMLGHSTLWEDSLICEKRNQVMGIPADAKSTKVRRGESRPRSEALGGAVAEAWRSKWSSRVEPVTGCADYAALRRAWAAEAE